MGGVGRSAIALGWRRVGLTIVVLVIASSCSLEGLDRFTFPTCNPDGHTGCEALNLRDGIDENACELWQCDSAGHYCVRGPRDIDHDGYVDHACTGGDDCDDHLVSAHPNASESCDGADNDCNGLVDDIDPTMPPGTSLTSAVLSGTSGPTFLDLTDAPDGFYAVWHAAGQTRNALVLQTDSETPSTVLLGQTNTDPNTGLTESAATMGCATQTEISLLPFPCPASGVCSGSQVCVAAPSGAMICEQPVLHNVPTQLPGECQTHAQCSDGIACNGLEQCEPRSDPSLFIPGGIPGCRRGNTNPCATMGRCVEAYSACVMPVISDCNFGDLRAAWSGGGELMTASVNIDGCVSGRVRVGLVSTTDSPPTDIFWGGDELSTTWAGVDLTRAGCTGASRTTGPVGARHTSIAALPRDPAVSRASSEALAVWTTPPSSAGGPSPVEILGLWREQLNVSMATVRFINGASNGQPLHLTDATTSEHVGVASYAHGAAAGYVVAYARDGGGVSVTTLPQLGRVAPRCSDDAVCSGTAPPLGCHDVCSGTTGCMPGMHCSTDHTCVADCSATVPCAYGTCNTGSGTCMGGTCLLQPSGADAIFGTSDDPQPTTSLQPPIAPERPTPTMGTPITLMLDASTTVVGDVTAAAGGPVSLDPPTTQLRLALAWATSSEVVVALAQVDASTHVITDGTRLRITAAGARDVRVVHVEAGIALAGQFPTGTITDTEIGGFVVTWATNAGTFAARISDHTGALVAPGAVLLGTPGEQPLAFVDYDDAGGNPRVRVAAHQDDVVVVFPNVCGPPAL